MSSELAEIRVAIDEIDETVARLLADRLALTKRARSIKDGIGLPPQDYTREAQIVGRVTAIGGPLAFAAYLKILDVSRSLADAP